MRWVQKVLPAGFAVLMLIAACVNAVVNTALDSIPSPQGHSLPLHRILVLAAIGDIRTRLAAENAAVPQAARAGVADTSLHYAPVAPSTDPYAIQNQGTAVTLRGSAPSPSVVVRSTVFLSSYRYLPPLEQWEQFPAQQKDSLLAADTIDAVMVIAPTGSGATESSYGSSATKCTSVDPSTGACRSTRTSSTSGTISEPWLSTSIRVIAVDSKHILWSATANSGGGSLSGYGDLAASVVTRAIQQLRSDGLIN